MPKKVVLDVDPGIVDAMVLCLAAFEPSIEIVALTSTGGNVPADIAARNLQGLIEFLDPPRLPRIGIGRKTDERNALDYRHVHGIDGLNGTPLVIAELRSQHPAEKVILEAVRNDPDNVMIICLGPLTNIARAAALDPEFSNLVRHIYITGGSFNGEGNISACAEFNIYADISAAQTVFHLPCTKTLVPLNITNQVLLTLQHLERFPDKATKIGGLLHRMLLPAFQTYRQCYGFGGIHIHDLVTYLIAINPSWAKTQELPVEIETEGAFTKGMTIFDRRPRPEFSMMLDVVTEIDERQLLNEIIDRFNELADENAVTEM
ncbi:nucleoside hydrolase [Planctomycetales bacterium]|nr:nucleoside hydrolase [Planctomycetales bacterium]